MRNKDVIVMYWNVYICVHALLVVLIDISRRSIREVCFVPMD